MTQSAPVLPPLTPATEAEIAALSRRARQAGGPLMKVISFAGSRAEGLMAHIPDAMRTRIEDATAFGLRRCYSAANMARSSTRLPASGKHGHRIAAVLSGGAGGLGGLPSAVVELPATVSIFFAAIQKVAVEYGFDPNDEAVRLECLRVFGSGTPFEEDDGVNTAFLASRLAMTGIGAQGMIATIAPRLAAVLSQKLAAQTVPVLGAVTGATVNLAFITYYQELAHVRFGLLKLAKAHPEGEVMQAFRAAGAKALR
ncbi:EcsC family protein [Falsirhodobacter halotolerans]|uniref:EcsC family protein n=1 Tax=Falsirhodobacter halotolerans TaxID=1146892 RepID=UPI001FD0C790|nr:EcsC family protein [Falsirhodobacter halotolerans]MCJ8140155.1 EcsC family protein [Falsirhodobacter halotolerans]